MNSQVSLAATFLERYTQLSYSSSKRPLWALAAG